MPQPSDKGMSPVDDAQALDAQAQRLRAKRSAAPPEEGAPPTTLGLLWVAYDRLASDRAALAARLEAAERAVVAERADDPDAMRRRDEAAAVMLDGLQRTRRRMRADHGPELADPYGFAEPPSRLTPAGLDRYAANALSLLAQRPFERVGPFGHTLTSEAISAYLRPLLDTLVAAIAQVQRERDELSDAIAARDALVAQLAHLNRASRLTLEAIATLADSPAGA